MNKNRLMAMYDKSYASTFEQILRITPNREEAKKLLGRIYKETWNTILEARGDADEVDVVFEQVKQKYGIWASPNN